MTLIELNNDTSLHTKLYLQIKHIQTMLTNDKLDLILHNIRLTRQIFIPWTPREFQKIVFQEIIFQELLFQEIVFQEIIFQEIVFQEFEFQ